MVKNMRAIVIANRSKITKRSNTGSSVSQLRGPPLVALTRYITAAMNMLNLVQNLIIVSALCVMHSFVNSLVSDSWVAGRVDDSRAPNREQPIGVQLLRILYRILGSSKPNCLGQITIFDNRAALQPAQHAWFGVPIHKPITRGCRETTRAPQ